ncbi:MAG TPA: LuxR C-terminal-related transcriptional regulator [Petrimonas sp.]|nr:LuxR C-terminal-related transcriptional regulator [Petrimonas sp.]
MPSAREMEIIKMLSKGLINKDIAETLRLSPYTVKRHIENIYKKLKVHNRVELMLKVNKKERH